MADVELFQKTKKSQLADQIRADIADGTYPAGTSLPRQDALIERYGVSGPTLRKVLTALVEQGALTRTPQGGIVVPMAGAGRNEGGGASTARRVTIAVFLAGDTDFNFVAMQRGVMQYANEAGISYTVLLSPEGHDQVVAGLQEIDAAQVGGLILLPYNQPAYVSAIAALVAREFPLVCVDRRVGETPVCVVRADNASGMYQATHHLIDRHRREVHLITGPMEHTARIQRYRGYRQAMSDAGFGDRVEACTHVMVGGDDDPRFWSGENRSAHADAAIERMFDEVSGPVSVACVDDYVARRVYVLAEGRSRAIGRDVFVTGFDDLPMATLVTPTLTTIRQPRERIGYEAARVLHQRILGNIREPMDVHLPVELIVRESA